MLLQLLMSILPGLIPTWMVLARLVPQGTSGRISLIAGYGLLLGFIYITMGMRFLSLLGISFSTVAIALSTLPLILLWWCLPQAAVSSDAQQISPEATTRAEKLLIALCLGLIALRLGVLAVEVLHNPVFPWDAKQHWAKQAKVFLDHGSLVPYVTDPTWLGRYEAGVYTSLHPDYPVTIPLLQTWMGVGLGGWHDVYVNLPWLLAYLAFGAVFYGQVRSAGGGRVIGLVGTYMLLSLPLLNIHVALAGYADLFMGLAFLGALAAFMRWSRSGEGWQGLLAGLCAISCVLLKQEGLFWALAFLPGLFVKYLGGRRGYLLLMLVAASGGLLILLLPPGVLIFGHNIGKLHFAYNADAWYPLLEGFFLQDNWHLLAYIALFVLLGALAIDRRALVAYLPALTVLFCACSQYLVIYLFTLYSSEAAGHGSISRVAMHFIPALWFVCIVLFHHLLEQRGVTQKQ